MRDAGGLVAAPFQARSVLAMWCDTIGDAFGGEIHLAEVRNRQGQPQLFMPLTVKRAVGARVLQFADAGVSDGNAPVFDPRVRWSSEQMWSIFARIAKELRVDMIDIGKIPGTVSGHTNPLALLATGTFTDASYRIEMRGSDWNSYANNARRRHHLKKVKRRRRALERLGAVTLRFARTRSEAADLVQTMITWKRKKLSQHGDHDIYARPDVREYCLRLATTPIRDGKFPVVALMLGDRPIAIDLEVCGGDGLVGVGTSYDEDYRQFGPGIMLLAGKIESEFQNGAKWYDLSIGGHHYKEYLSTTRTKNVEIRKALTLAGLTFKNLSLLKRVPVVERQYNRIWFRRNKEGRARS